jgi:MFS family permease
MEKSRSNWLAFTLCVLAYACGGALSTLMSVYLPVAVPELLSKSLFINDLETISASINAAFIFGWMFGGLLFGILSDKIGRIKTLFLSTFMSGLFTVLIVGVTSWQLLFLYRFLTGFGVGGILLVTTVYLSEIWKNDNKQVILGILAVFFPVGIVLAGGLDVSVAYWKNAFWMGVLPLIISIIILTRLPESNYFLALKKGRNNDLRQKLWTKKYRKNLIVGALIYGSILIGFWAIFAWMPTWIQHLLAGVSDGQNERGLAMMLLGIGGIVGGFFSGFLIKKIGMRSTLILTFGACFLACTLLFLTNSRFSTVIYAEIALLSFFFGVSQGALSSYIPELFPPEIRGAATGFCFNISRFFTAAGVFFAGSLGAFFGGLGNALSCFSLAFLVALLTTYFSKIASNTEGSPLLF